MSKAAAKKSTKAKIENPVANTEDKKLDVLKSGSAPRQTAPEHSDIAVRAWEIWQAKGCPPGCDIENWEQAEKELRERR